MKKLRQQICSNCTRKRTCQGRCARLPHRDRWGKRMVSLKRTWEGRMLTQKILDIEDTLPPRQKEVAQMYYRLGLTQVRIAEQLGVTQGSVSRTLARIHARVHRQYHKSLEQLRANLRRASGAKPQNGSGKSK